MSEIKPITPNQDEIDFYNKQYIAMFSGKNKTLTEVWGAIADLVRADGRIKILNENTKEHSLSLSTEGGGGTFKVESAATKGLYKVTTSSAGGGVNRDLSTVRMADELIEYVRKNRSTPKDTGMSLGH